jgi:hypothetical protein
LDWFTGEEIKACEYPAGSNSRYCWSASVWLGAVVGEDTIVSIAADGWQQGREMNPLPGTELVMRSTLSSDPDIRAGAISELDIIGTYTDTFTTGVTHLQDDYIDHRPHLPLGVTIEHTSYSWSLPDLEDLVLFSYSIRNIGSAFLKDAYIGLLVDADVAGDEDSPQGSLDDVAGYRTVAVVETGSVCQVLPINRIPAAWIADNDGDWNQSVACTGVTGVAVLGEPIGVNKRSFNWWVCNGNPSLDFGPRRISSMREFGTGGSGTPEGDRNKYFLLSNNEIDYDQAFTNSIEASDPEWEYPQNRPLAGAISRGVDTRYLISVGPFDLSPNESVPLVFAYVAGEGFHQIASNGNNLPENPEAYIANLNFTDFERNIRTAAQVYDVPGLDSDQDGYAGTFEVCEGDTIYITGDGVPDFLPVAGCGVARTGNIDGDRIDGVNLSDLSLLIAYLSIPNMQIGCLSEANVNSKDTIDLSDLSTLISYLTVPGSVELPWCR